MKLNRFKKAVLLAVTVGITMTYGAQGVASDAVQTQQHKARTVVTTDGEIDDMDSFLRFLLYTNEMNVDGIIYSSSQWHYKGDGKGTKFISEMPLTRDWYGEKTDLRWCGTEWIQSFIGKYREIYPNLLKHDKNYPAPEALLAKVKIGNIDFEGEMDKDTEGSDHIKNVLLDAGTEPVYLQVWGGTNTIARALKSIEDEYKNTPEWDAIYAKVVKKAVIYAILDQDATYQKYIAKNWPDIQVLYNSAQFWCFAYDWPKTVPEELKPYLQGKWMAKNIKYGHGPLMDEYMVWGDGHAITEDSDDKYGDIEYTKKSGRGQYDFISEGDTPAYLHLVDVGMRSLENPSNGGWAGRLIKSPTNKNRWEDGENVADYNPHTKQFDKSYPQTRWVNAIQNDFAARVLWMTKDYDAANHAPKVSVKGKLDITAKAGQKMKLSGTATDPDGDKLNYKWWQYQEAGTYQGALELKHADRKDIGFKIPQDAKIGDTIHMILEVTDDGAPPMTRYQHVVITIGE